MSRRVYLAARYSRRLELCGYRDRLRQLGYTVTSRWLDGDHQVFDAGVAIGTRGESLVEWSAEGPESAALRSKFARDDWEDVISCDLLIAFTEHPRAVRTRGGRHVELGIALGASKDVIVVGPRENIFCWLDRLVVVPTFEQCIELLCTADHEATALAGGFCEYCGAPEAAG